MLLHRPILAAIALVASSAARYGGTTSSGGHRRWIYRRGVMRFAAVLFIKLLEKFPRFELSAYLLVLVIGGNCSRIGD